jgi:serine/threonine protein kinase
MEEKQDVPALSSSVARLLEIEKVCRRFEAAWKWGGRPRVADYLQEVPEPQRDELRRELEAIDAEYRRASGEGISLEVFVRRLAECGLMTAEEIQAFVEALSDQEKPATAAQLARQMHAGGRLTKFQARAIYQGKTKGLVLGNYVVLDKLGQGGMGQVFKAQHRKMERLVALKILPSSATKSPEAVKRFQREVKAAARLSHPNIVTAYDADECSGLHFLVMEYVDGSDLSSQVREHGPMQVGAAVDCVVQAARGLEYAHRRGIVHRDIKPANLLRDAGGTVKVLDMGLARVKEASGPGGKAEGSLTQNGQVMGTLDYMAPEQAADVKLADARADIYSLGCTLYYLLSGRPPFGGETLTQKILAHREEPTPSVRGARPDAPERLDQLIQRMLAKQPEGRPQTMGEVIGLLEEFRVVEAGSEPSLVAPPPIAPAPAGDTLNLTASGLVDTASKSHAEEPPWRRLVRRRAAARPSPVVRLWKKVTNLTGRQKRILVGVAVAAGLAAVALGVIVSLKTPQGTLLVEIDEPDVTVQVLNSEGKIILERAAGKGTLTLSVEPGTHRLRLEKDGLEIFAKEFTLAAGGRQIITARLDRAGQTPPLPGPGPEAPADARQPTAPYTSTVVDAEGNLIGDKSLRFMDIVESSIHEENGQYVLSVVTAAPFPAPAEMAADRRVDFIWLIDIDRSRATGQKVWGNDYNVHLYLNNSGWRAAYFRTSKVARQTKTRPALGDFRAQVEGNRATLRFPKHYLASDSFDWCVSSMDGNSRDWLPRTRNPDTRRTAYTLPQGATTGKATGGGPG